MATKITLWSPDTCGCSIEYAWDDREDPDVRVHRWRRNTRICPGHAGIGDNAQVYQTCLDENRRKNYSLAILAERGIDPDLIQWSFDERRTLRLETSPANVAARSKEKLQQALDARFGADKVAVF